MRETCHRRSVTNTENIQYEVKRKQLYITMQTDGSIETCSRKGSQQEVEPLVRITVVVLLNQEVCEIWQLLGA